MGEERENRREREGGREMEQDRKRGEKRDGTGEKEVGKRDGMG